MEERVNSLPNHKISDWSKLKALADDKIYVPKKLKSVLAREENIVGKGENAGYQHFLLFPKCYQKVSFTEVFNPFPNKPWFLRVCSTSLLTTLWEKEKLLVMRNCS